MIRDVLLGVYALAWLIVVVLKAWRTSEIDSVLWATLGVGVGVILGIFRVDDQNNKKDSPAPDREKAQ